MSANDIVLKQGKLSALPADQQPGTLLFAQDDTYSKSGKLYLDIDGSDRVKVSGVGYDLSGQSVQRDSDIAPAGPGAEIFNDYRKRTIDDQNNKSGNVATGDYSTASGLGTTALGKASFAIGNNNTAEGETSFAGGKNSFVNGDFSAGFGENTQVSGEGSFGIGKGTRAIGDYSFVGGQSDEYIDLKIASNLGNNQYKVTNLDNSSDYIDDTKQLTNLGKLSIGSIVFQINDSNNNQGSIAIVENKEKNESNECIITLKKQDSTFNDLIFYTGTFQFVQGGAYSKNSFSYGKNCTVAGNNSISGGNSINVWGSNSIGWGNAEAWNLEGDKANLQDKINECDQRILNYQILLGQIEEPEDPEESDTEETDKTEEENKELTLAQRAYYSALINLILIEKSTYVLRLNKINLYTTYDGVGNNSAVFGLNNSSSSDGSLIGGKYNKSYGNNSLIAGEGNISHYSNMTVLGKFSNSYEYSDEGVLNYDYITKTGTSNHNKVESYSFPQLLIGNGGVSTGDSNSFEVFSNGLIRAAKSFRVEETGEIGILSEQIGNTNYRGLKLTAFNTTLFLDSGHYICPPPSKSEKLELGAPSSVWKKIWTRGLDISHQMSVSNSAFFKGYVFHNRGIQISSGKATGEDDTKQNEGVLFYDDSGNYTNAEKFKAVVKIKTNIANNVSRPAFSLYLNHANTGNFKTDFSLFYGPINKDRASLYPGDGTTAPKIDLGETSHPWGVLYSGSVNTGRIDSNSIYPKATASYSLGSGTYRWNALYLRGLNISPPGEKDGDTELVGGVYSNLLPNGTRNLGSTTYRWNGLYVKGIDASSTLTVSGTTTVKNNLWTNNIYPNTTSSTGNDGYLLGNSENRWKQLYAAKTTINTSDIRTKDVQEETILVKLLNLYEQLTPIAYKFKNTGPKIIHDRIHVGFSSQEVEEKLIKNELTALDFGGFCKDPVYKKDENGENTDEIIDYIYGLRYGEFHGLHMMKNHQQDARLAELEEKNQELENTVSNLKAQIELLKLAIGG